MKSFSTYISLCLCAVMFSACNQKKMKQLELANAELSAYNIRQDSIINDFITAFNTFEDNLSAIKERENLIEVSASDPELRREGKEKINDDLASINALLEENRNIIEELNKKLKSSSSNNRKLRSSIARLSKQLEEKSGEIALLEEKLEEQNLEIGRLVKENSSLAFTKDTLVRKSINQANLIAAQEGKIQSQDMDIQAKTDALNKAFYIAASKKELKKLNVLDGRYLNPNFDPSAFTQIDITEVQNIPVSAKRVKLLSPHPDEAYQLESADRQVTGLAILDPAAFWKNTKYLVVVTD